MHPHLPHIGESWKTIIIVLLGYTSFTFGDTLSKILIQDYSVWQILFINNSLSILILGSWIYKSGGKKAFKPINLKLHVIRAFIGALTGICIIKALETLPLPDFYGIIFSSPFILLVMVYIFLHEHIGKHRWIAVTIGFTGVLILTGPQYNSFPIGIIFALSAVFCISAGSILLRKIGKGDHVALYGFYPCLFALIASVPFVITDFQIPESGDLILFFLNSIFVISGIILIAYGITQAREISAIAPFVYVQLIWGTIFSYFIFNEDIKMTTAIGLTLIISAGLYNIYRERNARKLATR